MRGRSNNLASCAACCAGALLGFNWSDAQQSPAAEIKSVANALAFYRQLRVGSLYRCDQCGSLWHLNGAEKWMSVVPKGRENLIDEWDAGPIRLGKEKSRILRRIGANAPSFLGIGSESRDTPCSVTTYSGERFDCSMVSRQTDAPVHGWRNYRLASAIAEIQESPYALPLKVRRASDRAEEIAMGFAPTLVEMPDTEEFTLNGSSTFLVSSRSPAKQARLSGRQIDRSNVPPIASDPDEIIYFVADPE